MEGATPELVIRSVELTMRAQTARVKLCMAPTEGALPWSAINAEGMVDFSRRRTAMKWTFLEGEGTVGNESFQVVADGAIYQQIRVDDESKWVQLSGSEGPSADPLGILDWLRGVDAVESSGEGQVSGTHAVHYKLRLSSDKAIERAPNDIRHFVWEGLRYAPLLGKEISAEAWIDTEGRICKLSMVIPMLQIDGGEGNVGNLEASMELYGFGAEVQILVPSGKDLLPPLE
jgi:hypothetical protein